jgi:hypothetical protein
MINPGMKVALIKNCWRVEIQTFLTLLAFILICSSCQKEATLEIGPTTQPPTTPPPTNGAHKVKTYTEDVTYGGGQHVKETFNLTYDNNDRLLSLISTTVLGNKLVYQYNTDNTYTMDIYVANVLSIHELFYLNTIPLVDSIVQYDAVGKDTTTEKYIYNSSKQLVTLKEYRYSKTTGATLLAQTNSTYDNSGNLIKEASTGYTATYDYYPDLVNNFSVGLIYYYQSKNLVKTTTENSGSTVTINHTYTFDSSNRLLSEKEVFSDGNVTIKSYTY